MAPECKGLGCGRWRSIGVDRADGNPHKCVRSTLDYGPLEGAGFLCRSVTHQRPSQYLLRSQVRRRQRRLQVLCSARDFHVNPARYALSVLSWAPTWKPRSSFFLSIVVFFITPRAQTWNLIDAQILSTSRLAEPS